MVLKDIESSLKILFLVVFAYCYLSYTCQSSQQRLWREMFKRLCTTTTRYVTCFQQKAPKVTLQERLLAEYDKYTLTVNQPIFKKIPCRPQTMFSLRSYCSCTNIRNISKCLCIFLVRSCFLITPINCLKGHNFLGCLCMFQYQNWSTQCSEWVTESRIELSSDCVRADKNRLYFCHLCLAKNVLFFAHSINASANPPTAILPYLQMKIHFFTQFGRRVLPLCKTCVADFLT